MDPSAGFVAEAKRAFSRLMFLACIATVTIATSIILIVVIVALREKGLL
jgi:hypothetical protein